MKNHHDRLNTNDFPWLINYLLLAKLRFTWYHTLNVAHREAVPPLPPWILGVWPGHVRYNNSDRVSSDDSRKVSRISGQFCFGEILKFKVRWLRDQKFKFKEQNSIDEWADARLNTNYFVPLPEGPNWSVGKKWKNFPRSRSC